MMGILVAVSGSLFFIKLADEVLEGGTQHFDTWMIEHLQKPAPPIDPLGSPATIPTGPPWLREMGRDVTALGGVAVLMLVTFAVAGYLLMIRKYHAMWLMLIATFGGLFISTALKRAIDRPRPSVSHYSYVYTSSFPSGHSMLSAVVYLTLGSMMTRLVPRRSEKIYCLTVALLLTFLVGVSRIYMGVHYPTDVLAGWCAGLVWAVLCWLATRYLQTRGAVEHDTETLRPD